MKIDRPLTQLASGHRHTPTDDNCQLSKALGRYRDETQGVQRETSKVASASRRLSRLVRRDTQHEPGTAIICFATIGTSIGRADGQQCHGPSARAERYDRRSQSAAGTGPQAYRTAVSARYASRLHPAHGVHLQQPVSALQADRIILRRGLGNSPRLAALLKDGKIYLSLADAITLTLEDNFDIAIARINLDIADTDILRARAGSTLRGVSTGLVENTLGGATSTVTGGGGPGGTSNSVGGGGTGVSGLVLSTNGGGPTPEPLDPSFTGGLEYEAQNHQPR